MPTIIPTIYGSDLDQVMIGTIESEIIFAFGGNDIVYAGNGNDSIDGGWGNDFLFGQNGDDTLMGGGGNDTLDGGEGSDIYIVTGNSAIGMQGYETYRDTGSVGSDRILAQGVGNVDIGVLNFSPASGIEIVDGTGATGTVRMLGDWQANLLDFSTVQFVGNNIVIDGDGQDDTIIGTQGNDSIIGGSGNDILNGGNGSDTYIVTGNEALGWPIYQGLDDYRDTGATGTDKIVAIGSGNVDIGVLGFSAASGIEVIDGTGAAGIVRVRSQNFANLLNFSTVQFIGSNIWIDGSRGIDTITGTQGNDTIVGGGDADVMDGGQGSDTYRITGNLDLDDWLFFEDHDIYRDTGTVGIDKIVAIGPGNVDIGLVNFSASISGIEIIDGTGASGSVKLAGNWLNNYLDFSNTQFIGNNIWIYGDLMREDGGFDTLIGSQGNDSIVGGGGYDTMDGSNGSDVYFIDHNFSEGWAWFSGYDTYRDTGTVGTDRIIASGGGNVDIGILDFSQSGIEIIDGTAAAGTVTLLGSWDPNVMNFSNVQFLGSRFVIDGNSGNDTITGSQGNDTILGGNGDDILKGLGGDDFIDGGTGYANDSIDGGEGSDRYLCTGNLAGGATVFGGYDTYQDTGLTGIDTLVASGLGNVDVGLSNFSATSGIERVDGTGATGSFRLVGDYQANTLNFSNVQFLSSNIYIDGDGGSDSITGTQGNDVIIGGTGNDLVNGGNGSDRYLVSGSGAAFQHHDTYADTGTIGTDVIAATGIGNVDIGMLNFSAANGIEKIDGTGVTGQVQILGDWQANVLDFSSTQLVGSNIVINGDAQADTLIGSSGNDTIYGGQGGDYLTGGLGADTLSGGEGWNSFIFNSIAEIGKGLGTRDVITDFQPGQDGIYLSAIDANSLIAGDQAFTFIGSTDFSGQAGQLRFASGVLSGDINADRIADFELAFTNGAAPAAYNFVL